MIYVTVSAYGLIVPYRPIVIFFTIKNKWKVYKLLSGVVTAMTKMLTANQVQTLLHVDRSTIYRMADDGRLPAIKVGRQWRFPAAKIEAWLQGQGVIQSQAEISAESIPISTPSRDLTAILPLDCVQPLQDTLADALGIMLVITDMAGNPVTQVSNRCGLFNSLADVPILWQMCRDHWHKMAASLDMQPRWQRSELGLICARGLIRVGPTIQGMVFLGGIAPEQWPLTGEAEQKLADQLGISAARLAKYLPDVFYLSAEKQAHALSLIQPTANIISHIIAERSQLLDKLNAIKQLATL